MITRNANCKVLISYIIETIESMKCTYQSNLIMATVTWKWLRGAPETYKFIRKYSQKESYYQILLESTLYHTVATLQKGTILLEASLKSVQ